MGLWKKRPQASSHNGVKKKGKVGRFFSAFGRCIAILIFMGIIAGSTAAAMFSVYVFNSLEGEPDLRLEDITMSNTSTVYAIDSETGEYQKIRELHGDQNRQEIQYSDIPKDVINCVVAAEDKRYWEHNGVDWIRTIASTITFITGTDTQGGSTITQQVIKNLTGNDAFSPERKVKEIFAAIKLNKYYSKEQVLEVYLNYVFFGNNLNGIQAAANGYFNKDVSELNMAEIATIIATTKNPTKFNPRTENGMRENKIRREYILNEMVKMGTLSAEDYDYWVDYDVEVVKKRQEATVQLSDGWYIDQVIEDVVNDLMEEKGYTRDYAESYIKNGGLSIYACVDEEIQAKMEAVYADNANFPPVNNETYPETAAITIAPTGQILGIIGGNEKTTARGWNNATMTVRHPGSSIKPISAYLQAFESDLVTWSSLWDDNPIPDYFGPNQPGPKNYDARYRGAVTIQYAIQQSVNTVPVKLIQTVTPERSYNFLKNKFQFGSLSENDISLSPMALGGMTYGVTLRELTGAYQVFVSEGKYVKPYTYTKVTDRDGNIVLEQNTTQVRIISDQTATILNKLLQTVITQGTGAAGNLYSIGMPAGGKTGSSTGTKLVNGVITPVDNDNLWFVGFTPYYITGVWMGYDDHSEIYYSSYPTPKLWKNIMLPLHEGLSPKQFAENEHVVQMTYCLETGEIATPNCTETAVGWYKDTVIPSNCTYHFSGYYNEEDEDSSQNRINWDDWFNDDDD